MGRKPKTNTRNDRKDLIQNPTPDQLDDGYKEASKLVSLHEEPTTKSDQTPHMLLPGVTKLSGDLIQAVVAMRLQGFRDVDIAKHINTSQPNISRLESKYREAFLKAEVHALENVERKYLVNLWGIRAALSEAGPEMIKVLVGLAQNAETKDNVRKDCAIAVLNMIGAGYSRTSKGGKDSTVDPRTNNVMQTIINAPASAAEATVITVEDAEIVESDRFADEPAAVHDMEENS